MPSELISVTSLATGIPFKVSTSRIVKFIALNPSAQKSGLLVTGISYTITSYATGDDFTNVGGVNVAGTTFTATGTTPTSWINASSLIRPAQPSGLLVVGQTYVISNFKAGDNFSNVGAASNSDGVIFVATGTTPTTWTNLSVLYSGINSDLNYVDNYENTLKNVRVVETPFVINAAAENTVPVTVYAYPYPNYILYLNVDFFALVSSVSIRPFGWNNGSALINSTQTSGLLVIGQTYIIGAFVAGDNFTNVGAASNATGVVFTATGTTPTTWTNSSSLSIYQTYGTLISGTSYTIYNFVAGDNFTNVGGANITGYTFTASGPLAIVKYDSHEIGFEHIPVMETAAQIQVLVNALNPGGVGQSSILFEDEGVALGSSGTVTEVDYVGAGVTATRVLDKLTVTIPGAAAAQAQLQFEDEGVNLGTAGTATELDFVGAGITATRVLNKVTVTVPGAVAGQDSLQFEDEGVNLGTSGTATELDFVGAGVTATRVLNKVTVTVPAGAGGISAFASFYGLTTGTGNGGPNDYAATVAVKTAAGTGRVPFPRTGPTLGGIVNGSTVFTIPTAGTYEVNFVVNVDEAAQLQLEVNGTELPETTSSRATGTNQIIGSSIITVPAGALLAVINPAGNAAALTVTPADGTLTHAVAQTLTIKLLA